MIKTLLTFISLFNFCDWVVAFFIAGTAARIEVKRTPDETGPGRRTLLAVGLMVFFTMFGLVRMGEFANLVVHAESFRGLLGQVPESYTFTATILSAFKTLTLLFCWFAVTLEKRERQGRLSGNVIRHWMLPLFEKLR